MYLFFQTVCSNYKSLILHGLSIMAYKVFPLQTVEPFTLFLNFETSKQGRTNKTLRLILINFKKLTTFSIFNLKTCFDVANIIVSYKIFEKPLGLYNN